MDQKVMWTRPLKKITHTHTHTSTFERAAAASARTQHMSYQRQSSELENDALRQTTLMSSIHPQEKT